MTHSQSDFSRLTNKLPRESRTIHRQNKDFFLNTPKQASPVFLKSPVTSWYQIFITSSVVRSFKFAITSGATKLVL